MTEDQQDARRDPRGLGGRPGVNENPLGAEFRDGPRTSPASTRSLLLGLLPVAAIGLVLLVLALR